MSILEKLQKKKTEGVPENNETKKKADEDLGVLSALDKTVTNTDNRVTMTPAEILQQKKLKAEVVKAQLEAQKAQIELENLKNKPAQTPQKTPTATPAQTKTKEKSEEIDKWSIKGIIKQIQESNWYTKTLATFGVSTASVNTLTNVVADAETDKEGWTFSRLAKLFSSGWDLLKSKLGIGNNTPETPPVKLPTLASNVEKITQDGDFQVLKDEIASKESGKSHFPYYSNPYDAYNRGNAGATPPIPKTPISKMSFEQVQKKQKQKFGTKGRLNAVGKYQATKHGLEEARIFFKFSKDTILTPDVQEKIGDYLFLHKRPICRAYFSGTSNNIDGVMKELALEFSSVPDPFKMRTKHQEKGGYKDLKGAGGNKRYNKIRNLIINARKDLLTPKKEKIPKYMTATSVEKNLTTKEKTTPYIHLSKKNKKKTIETQLFELNYPATLFIDNGKHNPIELQKQIFKIKALYKTQKNTGKNKTVDIFMDNEGGKVQRVRAYAGNAGPKEKEVQNLLDTYVPQAGSLRQGKPSIRSMEKLFSKISKEEQTDIMTKYAQVRIHQEKTLRLNSISLVLDQGADKPRFENKKQKEEYNKKGDVINTRGFANKEMRKRYAEILITEAEKAGQKVLLKHFPGHHGIPNPHFQPLGTKKAMDEEMETFLEILDANKDKKNIIVMLGHIKLNIPNTEWDSEGKPIFASKKIMDKLHARYPNITFMTDDIGGMEAITNKTEARENARKNNVYTLN